MSMEGKSNPMRAIRMSKLTLNMGVGEPGPGLERAKGVLQKLTERKIVETKAKKRNTFGGTKGRPIGVKVTLRGKEAEEVLRKLLQAVESRIKESSFDESGNVSFGVDEYINIPGIKYDPEIGIMGLDIAVTLERPGYRVKKRALRPAKIPARHRVSRQDAMDFMKSSFGVNIVTGKEE